MATLKDLLVSGPARVIGNITGKSFIKEGGTSSQFLKADGSVDSTAYSTTSHNHSGTYKPVQTAVSDPTASETTSTTFIDTISQNTNGVIAATKKTLPTASATVSGITKVGASGGAAAYNHNHATSIAKSTEDNQITLAFGTKYAIKAGGTSYVFTMPKNPNTDTTYTFATGDSNGQIKVTPSGGSAQNVSVKGLGSAAYTESSAYATSGHTHSGVYKPVQTAVSSPTASSTATAFIDTISQNTNGVIAATKKTLPTASATVAGITTVGASGGAAAYSHNHTTSIATSTGTNQITLAFGGKYAITAGGTSYVFTMPANPDTDVKVKQTAHTTTDTTEYPIITTTSASPTSGTAYEAKYATQAAVTGSGDIVLKKSSSKCKLQFDNSLNCLNFIFE